MLKFQLKLPEIKRPFSADETEDDAWTLALGLGPGEELATFRSNLLALDEENLRILAVDDESEIFQLRSDATFCRRGSKEISDHICAELDVVGSAKAKELEFELSQKIINVGILRSIASSGLPDGGGLRAKTWKLLLGYLSPARDSWEQELAETRVRYAALKGDLLLNPSEFTRKHQAVVSSEQEQENDLDGSLRRHEISHGDHPLSLGVASVWNQYFQDAEIVEQIDRDLQRTHPNMRFFSGDTSVGLENQEAMRNILFLFAKLNPAIRYVQGMNEVLAPLYYVLRTDPDERNSSNAEADSFACFVRLLSDSVDHFCQQLDNSSVGILSTLSRLGDLLKANDEELWRHLEISTKVKAQFYAFRWITLLLTQEFHLRSIMRIWDSLISNPFGVQEMLLRVCCAMLLCVKDDLLRGDFTANLKLLQHYPQIDVEYILQVAQELTPHSCNASL